MAGAAIMSPATTATPTAIAHGTAAMGLPRSAPRQAAPQNRSCQPLPVRRRVQPTEPGQSVSAKTRPCPVALSPRTDELTTRQIRGGAKLRPLPAAARALPSLAEELAPALRRPQLLRQLIAAGLAVELVLSLVGRPGLGQNLARDLVELAVDLGAGVTRDPGAIDRHHPRLHQPGPIAQLEHLAEQLGQRPLMAADEARDRRVIGNQIAGDHPVGHVLATVTLDRARRPLPGRERVQDKRH